MLKISLLVFFFATILMFLLELALRKSERLKLVAEPQKIENSETIQLNSRKVNDDALNAVTLQYGHVNQLHLKQITFRSQELNFISGWRLTTDQPTETTSSVFVFGGSTIQCIEVSDHFTICSCLQRLLNQNRKLIRVNNRGISGMTVKANYDLLVSTQIHPEDCVVFYFGVNDSKLETYLQQAKLPFSLIPGYIKVLGGLRILLRLRIAEWLWLETVKPADRTIKDVLANAANVSEILHEAFNYVTKNGASFLAILQPNIFTKKNLTRRDTEIYKKSKINPRIVKLQYAGYLNALSDKPWFRQLTNEVDGHKTSPYIDWNHLDESGNELIARKILKLIETEIVTRRR